MTIKEYLESSRITVDEFAKRVGTHRATVFRWLQGAQPKASAMGKIVAATGGKVSAEELLIQAIKKAG